MTDNSKRFGFGSKKNFSSNFQYFPKSNTSMEESEEKQEIKEEFQENHSHKQKNKQKQKNQSKSKNKSNETTNEKNKSKKEKSSDHAIQERKALDDYAINPELHKDLVIFYDE